MFKVGDRIVIKQNAFEGSDQPKDFLWRGKAAEVVDDFGDGAYEVYVKGEGTCLLKADEMQSASQPADGERESGVPGDKRGE